MSKVATYLQGHIAGQVMTRRDVRDIYANTASVLQAKPEMVIYPRSTNDIRKVARFAWQLAEKGHPLTVSPRGAGTDPTGAAPSALTLALAPHMHKIYEYDTKQRLIRVQPGATIAAVQNALGLHGATIPIPSEHPGATIGGAVAFGEASLVTGPSWVAQLEVVLDSGDVIQTGKITKREFGKRRGLQGREGDIYRGIDTILEDHAQLIDELRQTASRDVSGYAGILDVRSKGGSFDLTPLFLGSQGTLGVISEMILAARFAPNERVYGAAFFASSEVARDAVDDLLKLAPSSLEYIDGQLVAEALAQGNTYPWMGLEAAHNKTIATGALLIIGFDEFKDRKRARTLKRLTKKLASYECVSTTSIDTDVENLSRIVDYTTVQSTHTDRSSPEIVPGFYVPRNRFEDFLSGLQVLATKLHVDLPIHGDVISETYSVQPTLSLQRVGDKQKLFKLLDGLNALIVEHAGTLVARGGEGRLLSRFVRADWSQEHEQMMDEIKAVFDPHGIFNPGVKQPVELRELVAELRSDNSTGLSR